MLLSLLRNPMQDLLETTEFPCSTRAKDWERSGRHGRRPAKLSELTTAVSIRVTPKRSRRLQNSIRWAGGSRARTTPTIIRPPASALCGLATKEIDRAAAMPSNASRAELTL